MSGSTFCAAAAAVAVAGVFFFFFDFVLFAHSPFARAFIYINLFVVYLIFNEFQSARVHVHILFGAKTEQRQSRKKNATASCMGLRFSICYETDLWLFSILCL